MPTLAYSNEFVEAYARLPRAQKKKVREFTDKFQANPKSSAINYEKIHGVKDDKVRTVRIDKQYRAVILHPEQGDVYVLVWVDNHDEAMDWAGKKSFSINPKTGALQVVNLENVKQVIPPKPSSRKATLLANFDDATLDSFGIPEALLPAIRAVSNHDQLLAVNKHLPDEAAEALLWLAEDMLVEEIRAAVAKPATVDTSDLAAALENPDTKRRFVTVTSQEDLTRILDAPLEKWRIFLHPSQENLVRKHFNGPARVLGWPEPAKPS